MNGTVQEFDGQRSLRSHGSSMSITFKLPKENNANQPAHQASQGLSSSMKVQKNQKVDQPDLIFEQKISPTPTNRDHHNNSVHEGFTPKAASNKRRVSNKRGL